MCLYCDVLGMHGTLTLARVQQPFQASSMSTWHRAMMFVHHGVPRPPLHTAPAEEEEREKAEVAANVDKARKEKQKNKKARRKVRCI